MKLVSRFFTALSLVLFMSCGSDDNGGGSDDGGGGPEVIEATYRLTLTTNFTDATHPTDYPSGAMFGPMLGAAHSPSISIFSEGQLASGEFKTYIEGGDLSPLIEAITPTDDGSTSDLAISTASASAIGPTATTSVTVTVTPRSGRISFIARLSPSPDWFVGLDDFNLLGADNLLIDEATIELKPFDAGIDGGTTYNSDAMPNSETISEINGAPFSSGSGGLGELNPLGTLKIERIN